MDARREALPKRHGKRHSPDRCAGQLDLQRRHRWLGILRLVYAVCADASVSSTVHFDANAPAGSSATASGTAPDDIAAKYGKTYKIGEGSTLFIPGYTLSGWSTAADGSGTVFAPGGREQSFRHRWRNRYALRPVDTQALYDSFRRRRGRYRPYG